MVYRDQEIRFGINGFKISKLEDSAQPEMSSGQINFAWRTNERRGNSAAENALYIQGFDSSQHPTTLRIGDSGFTEVIGADSNLTPFFDAEAAQKHVQRAIAQLSIHEKSFETGRPFYDAVVGKLNESLDYLQAHGTFLTNMLPKPPKAH